MTLLGYNPVCSKISKRDYCLISFYEFKLGRNGPKWLETFNEIWVDGSMSSRSTVEEGHGRTLPVMKMI